MCCVVPSKKSAFTKAEFERAIRLVHQAGYLMTGFEKHADGFTIATRKPSEADGEDVVKIETPEDLRKLV